MTYKSAYTEEVALIASGSQQHFDGIKTTVPNVRRSKTGLMKSKSMKVTRRILQKSTAEWIDLREGEMAPMARGQISKRDGHPRWNQPSNSHRPNRCARQWRAQVIDQKCIAAVYGPDDIENARLFYGTYLLCSQQAAQGC